MQNGCRAVLKTEENHHDVPWCEVEEGLRSHGPSDSDPGFGRWRYDGAYVALIELHDARPQAADGISLARRRKFLRTAHRLNGCQVRGVPAHSSPFVIGPVEFARCGDRIAPRRLGC